MVEDIKVSVNILPFGQMKLRISSTGGNVEKKDIPVYYIEPKSTNIEKIEIFYEESLKDYKISETTDGR